MPALWFTFGRVLSDLEGSILGNSTNPLGVRWGRSDSERCSPPSSFPSVHLLTTFPFFTPLMWISPLTFHLFALKRAFSGEFPHLSTTFLSPSAICVQRDTSTFCSSWSTTGFQNQFWIIGICVTFQCHTPRCRPPLFLSLFSVQGLCMTIEIPPRQLSNWHYGVIINIRLWMPASPFGCIIWVYHACICIFWTVTCIL